MEKITFGKYILEKRKSMSLSQKELADKLYITESAVSKWERGLSYPDITLVTPICETLQVSEHELITASDDHYQRELENDARSFRSLIKKYSIITYLIYGIPLITCLICNIAVNHTLSWFFIVLTSEMVAFSLTNVPVLAEKKKGLLTLGAFYVSLNLLLLTCYIIIGGSWLGITSMSLLLAFVVVFLPFILRSIPLPEPIGSHKALLCTTIDTILVFALVMVITGDSLMSIAMLSTTFGVSFAWIYMLVIRYIHCNGLFKASICIFVAGIYTALSNSIFSVIIDHAPFHMPAFNILIWNEANMNGNIAFLIMAVALCFAIGGIALTVNSARK
ncbi:MAG: helix-turn-helix domain-containing protein [Clostridiales bacterium]|nr:helix-turn-helix domain-containing protein [Clostridiales bacterium]